MEEILVSGFKDEVISLSLNFSIVLDFCFYHFINYDFKFLNILDYLIKVSITTFPFL